MRLPATSRRIRTRDRKEKMNRMVPIKTRSQLTKRLSDEETQTVWNRRLEFKGVLF